MFPCRHAIVESVPDRGRYPTLEEYEAVVDGLAALPGVSARQVGLSRAGRPLRCLEFGEGPLHVVVVGVPRPADLVGTLVVESLVRALAETDLARASGFRFSIVPAADPDGMTLGASWATAPDDLEGLIAGAYQPARSEQVEWSFPIEYGRFAFTRPLPEARAVMHVLEAGPVDLLVTLRDERVAGASFRLSHDDTPLRGQLAAILAEAGVPAHRAEPETVPPAQELGPGVFAATALPEEYDYHLRYGADPAVVLDHGTSAGHYTAQLWDCLTLVAETPHFTTAKVADTGPAGVSRREARLRGIEIEQESRDWLWERYLTVAEELTEGTPWQRSVHGYLAAARDQLRAERRQVEREREFDDEATVAQLIAAVELRGLAALSHVGRFATMLAAEPVRGERLEAAAGEALARIRERIPALAASAAVRPVEVRRLAQTQLAALLCALEAVRDRHRAAHPRPPGRR